MFISVNGKAKRVVEIFAGGTDGKAHSVKELFGSVDGIARLLFASTPPATNGFGLFTWAEIKQLANEGKLLEHFNLYDKVTVQLKTPLENELSIYMTEHSKTVKVAQRQTEMQFQIVELTATKMRLMTPRANVLGVQSSNIRVLYSATTAIAEVWKQYAIDYTNNTNSARSNIKDIWGLTTMYNGLKTVQNALPDDLVNVLSVCARPITSWTKDSLSGKINITYDEDMKVRQLTTNKMSKTTKTVDGIVYPVINESYFPTTVGDYLYYINLPEEYDTYTQRQYMAKQGMFDGWKLLDYEVNDGKTYKQSWCLAPEASCAYSKGMTTTSEISTYNSLGSIKKDKDANVPTGEANHMFPEIIIEADT